MNPAFFFKLLLETRSFAPPLSCCFFTLFIAVLVLNRKFDLSVPPCSYATHFVMFISEQAL